MELQKKYDLISKQYEDLVKAHSEVKSLLDGMKHNYSQVQVELNNLVSTNKLKIGDLDKVNSLYSEINNN